MACGSLSLSILFISNLTSARYRLTCRDKKYCCRKYETAAACSYANTARRDAGDGKLPRLASSRGTVPEGRFLFVYLWYLSSDHAVLGSRMRVK
jgi:hypothetical protein